MLQKLIALGRPLLADGATGTNLFEVGLASGENPEPGTKPIRKASARCIRASSTPAPTSS